MATTTRIYTVTGPAGSTPRLVRAANPSQAIRHVVVNQFSADPAGQDVLVKLVGEGAKVETAGVELQSELAL
jgi:hypothetical protein